MKGSHRHVYVFALPLRQIFNLWIDPLRCHGQQLVWVTHVARNRQEHLRLLPVRVARGPKMIQHHQHVRLTPNQQNASCRTPSLAFWHGADHWHSSNQLQFFGLESVDIAGVLISYYFSRLFFGNPELVKWPKCVTDHTTVNIPVQNDCAWLELLRLCRGVFWHLGYLGLLFLHRKFLSPGLIALPLIRSFGLNLCLFSRLCNWYLLLPCLFRPLCLLLVLLRSLGQSGHGAGLRGCDRCRQPRSLRGPAACDPKAPVHC
mmetsp:Transcript_87588/g.165093  ORF Transcript_87588/g.165093 Transcript_87588/m.165093 type:complete len:260 (+) Transcript_87588:856-1635(+)